MAYTTTDLTSIERAIASGALTVMVDGQTITYRSVTELRKAHDFIRAQISGATGQRRSIHYFTPALRRD